MGSRAIQVVILVGLGLVAGWLLHRGNRAAAPVVETSAPAPPPPDISPEPPPPAPAEPPAVRYNLPSVAPPAAVPDPQAPSGEPRPAESPKRFVPKDWLLRGATPEGYEIASDRMVIFSGNASVSLGSLNEAQANRNSATVLQTALAAPYLGKRVELSAYLRAEGTRGYNTGFWFRAIDPANVVIAYDSSDLAAVQYADEWHQHRLVMDIPWNASEIAYGFSIAGPGKLWVDDVHVSVVDKAIPTTSRNQHVRNIGTIVQQESPDGPRARPSNLDFEEIVEERGKPRPPAPDSIKGRRF